MTGFCTKQCVPCEGGVPSLDEATAQGYLKELEAGWSLDEANKTLSRTFEFKGFGKTMSFTNAVAWIANQQGHHPDMQVSFNRCVVHFTTHAIDGLSENDFICAAKVDALLK